MEKQDIKSLSLEELKIEFSELGMPKYRAGQVFKWLHQRGVVSFEQMTDISKSLRNTLGNKYEVLSSEIITERVSKDGTRKYLLKLFDGEYIEAVLMKYRHGNTICISTQVGCRMGCTFCATGKGGLARNLFPSEMLSQIHVISSHSGEKISNIVMMGMGEPLDNYENVIKFLDIVSCDDGLNIGMRHISVSTCGMVDRIYDLADRKYQLTLSVSLHAPNDEIRCRTMPVSRKWSIDELLKACRYYSKTTGRRISFEYAMISGMNDSDENAKELAKRLDGTIAHVNLIPVNDVTGTGYKKSTIERQKKFISILSSAGFSATVRRTLGSDIEASCGQLKRQYNKGECHSED